MLQLRYMGSQLFLFRTQSRCRGQILADLLGAALATRPAQAVGLAIEVRQLLEAVGELERTLGFTTQGCQAGGQIFEVGR